jgi:hypothetical protein
VEARAGTRQEWILFAGTMLLTLLMLAASLAAIAGIHALLSDYSFSIAIWPIGLLLMVALMIGTTPMLNPLWFGGFMVQKLRDGYTKQEKPEDN